MLRSSLGFHTITLSLNLEHNQVQKLIGHFRQYSKKTGLIRMYHVDKKGKHTEYQLTGTNTYILPTHLKITYYKEYTGIKWSLRCNHWDNSFRTYFIEAKINPKILGGINDYITAATYDDMEAAIKNFNLEAKSISPILQSFEHYSIKRVDYCINLSLNELTSGCSSEQVMKLIKRGNIPSHYEEWKKYDDTAHRTKSRPGSFYLINPSANINCYSKYMQLQERSRENEIKGYPPVSRATLDAARDIIRFEVQCKYHKMYNLKSLAEKSGDLEYNKYKSLLSHETCNEIINFYFNRIIGKGDWYTLPDAIKKVQSHNFNRQKEDRLIDALKIVNDYRSIAKAKAAYQGDDLKAFKRTLKELSGLGINPVTIPKEWGIRHITNLLYTYYDNIQDENLKKQYMEEFISKDFYKYIKKFGCLPV